MANEMTIEELKALKTSGKFHHATYRGQGTLWEGLWIYAHDPNGFRGYIPVASFLKDSPNLDAAYAVVAGTGVSLGAYGLG